MTKQIVWIDDNVDRVARAKALKETFDVQTNFISVDGKDLKEEVLKLLKTPEPSLLIIDHVLDRAKTGDWTKYGSTLANILRENGWQNCPIIGVTAAEKYTMVDIEKYNYDDLIQYENFSDYIDYIPQLIDGFERCKGVTNIGDIITLLNVPPVEKKRVLISMPHNLKKEIQKTRYSSRVHYWFKNKFYNYPGFLLDKKWMATFIGVKAENVQGYIHELKEAKYNGIFNNPQSPRWWKVSLYKTIFGDEEPEDIYKLPQEKAYEKLNIRDEHRSICYVCKEYWPEVMAYVDESDDAEMKQMHLRCTVAHPNFSPEPMYEEIRMMKEH